MGNYLDENRIQHLHNEAVRDMLRMFEGRTRNLYVDNGDSRKTLESNMQSMFRTLKIANENYKVVIAYIKISVEKH